MKIESIGYCYAQESLSALRMILRLRPPQGMELPELDGDAFERAFAVLCDGGHLTPLGGSVGIDRLSTLLLAQMCNSGHWLRIATADLSITLWRGDAIFVAGAFPEGGPCVLTPLRDLNEATDHLMERTAVLKMPVTVMSSGFMPTQLVDFEALPSLIHTAFGA